MGANASTAVPLYASGQVLDAARLNLTNAGVPVFSGTATRDAAFGGSGEKVLAEGQLCYLEDSNSVLYYDSSAWQAVGPTAATVAVFCEQQAANTAGGTFTSGSFVKRVLNTTIVNNIVGCSIASSVITLPAGTYTVFATSPAYSVDNHQALLRNATDSTNTIIGTSARTNSTVDSVTESTVNGVFTIATSKTFELQHRCSLTRSTDGLGKPVNLGVNEVYANIYIEKTA